jgi:hypothetical protein
MQKIPIAENDRSGWIKLFDIFRKKEKRGLESALQTGLISYQEYLRISADRAVGKLEKFEEKMKKK